MGLPREGAAILSRANQGLAHGSHQIGIGIEPLHRQAVSVSSVTPLAAVSVQTRHEEMVHVGIGIEAREVDLERGGGRGWAVGLSALKTCAFGRRCGERPPPRMRWTMSPKGSPHRSNSADIE